MIPRQVQCFGFKITDADISFKKSQLQFSIYQSPVDTSEIIDFCESFYKNLRNHQSTLLKELDNKENPLLKGVGKLLGAQKKDMDKLKAVVDATMDQSQMFTDEL
jgi:hypothetical protein